MNRFLIFIVGLTIAVVGLSYIIIYLNLLVMGYTFWDYLDYIFGKFECLSFFIGYILILLLLFVKRRKKT